MQRGTQKEIPPHERWGGSQIKTTFWLGWVDSCGTLKYQAPTRSLSSSTNKAFVSVGITGGGGKRIADSGVCCHINFGVCSYSNRHVLIFGKCILVIGGEYYPYYPVEGFTCVRQNHEPHCSAWWHIPSVGWTLALYCGSFWRHCLLPFEKLLFKPTVPSLGLKATDSVKKSDRNMRWT